MIRNVTVTRLTVLLVALIGVIAIIYGSSNGIGISPDSVTYIGMARGFSGDVQTQAAVLGTHFPPFYPVLLNLTAHLSGQMVVGALWLAILFFALNITVIGGILSYLLPTSTWIPALGAAAYLIMDGLLITIHGQAFSEGPFLFFAFSGLLGLSYALDRHRRDILVTAAISIALACLTRYAGVTLIAVGAAAILLIRPTSRRAQLIDLILWVAVSAVPLGVWLLYGELTEGRLANRQFLVHIVPAQRLREGLTNLSKILLPDRMIISLGDALPPLVIAVLLIAGALIVWMSWRERREFIERYFRAPSYLKIMLRLFIPIYTVFILITISFFDSATPLDRRIFSPVTTAALLLICCAADALWRRGSGVTLARIAITVGALIFAVSSVPRVISDVVSDHSSGLGYANLTWQQSPLIAALRALPANTPIYTNGTDVASFLTNRQVMALPLLTDSNSSQPNPNYASQMAAMGADMAAHHGVIAFFDVVNRNYFPDKPTIRRALPRLSEQSLSDGSLYTLSPAS